MKTKNIFKVKKKFSLHVVRHEIFCLPFVCLQEYFLCKYLRTYEISVWKIYIVEVITRKCKIQNQIQQERKVISHIFISNSDFNPLELAQKFM